MLTEDIIFASVALTMCWFIVGGVVAFILLELKVDKLNAKKFVILSFLLGPTFTLTVCVISFFEKVTNYVNLPKLAYRFKMWFEK